MTHSWLIYLPPHLAADLLAHPKISPLERVLQTEAVALFADISGFTAMSEALGQGGSKGTEELAAILNRTFSTMITITQCYGGSIGKFAGDALTVVFPIPAPRTTHKKPRTKNHAPQPSASLRLCGAAVRRALQCALEMQEAIAKRAILATSVGQFRLSMKIGGGMGTLLTTTVGDPSLRLEYVLMRIQVEAALGITSQADAVAALDQLHSSRLEPAEQAEIGYTIWSIDPSRDADRLASADLYRTLFQAIPNSEYSERYKALTGEALPASAQLPAPPPIAAHTAVSTEMMLVLAARVLASVSTT